jgi:hypothetical protein
MIAVLANAPEIAVEKITRKIARHLFDLPAVTRIPVTLSPALLDKAVGTYRAEDGFSVEIGRDEDRLTLRGPIDDSLLPMSEAAYYASQDDEIEVHFADEQDGIFNALILRIPIYRVFKATRKQR